MSRLHKQCTVDVPGLSVRRPPDSSVYGWQLARRKELAAEVVSQGKAVFQQRCGPTGRFRVRGLRNPQVYFTIRPTLISIGRVSWQLRNKRFFSVNYYNVLQVVAFRNYLRITPKTIYKTFIFRIKNWWTLHFSLFRSSRSPHAP